LETEVSDNLEEGGDKLTLKNDEVFHWIYFKQKKDQENFIKEIEIEF
jgi:hypothetical protein